MIGTTAAVLAGIGAAAGIAGSVASGVGQANKAASQEGMLEAFQNKTGPYAQSEMERSGAAQMAKGQAGFEAALSNEVAQGSSATMDFANMLKSYAEGGNIPTAQDISRSNAYAQATFSPQQVAMQQAFKEQLTSANRQAALSGRGINDPILRAKLAQEQTRQNALLQAQQGAFAAQFAQRQPGERLGYMGQRAETLVGRGQLALQNQGALFGMGQQANQQGYNQRLSDFQTAFNAKAGIKSQGEAIGGALQGVGAGFTQMGGILQQEQAGQLAQDQFNWQKSVSDRQFELSGKYNDAYISNLGAQTNMYNAQAKMYGQPIQAVSLPPPPAPTGIGPITNGDQFARNLQNQQGPEPGWRVKSQNAARLGGHTLLFGGP